MSAETSLRMLVQQIRHLLLCQTAILLLDCPDPLLRHPLLHHLSIAPMISSTNDAFEQNLLDNKLVAALCDIAMQTGAIWSVDDSWVWPLTSSLLIVPIESSDGTLGVLLCVNHWEERFLQGEYTLLFQYLPELIQRIESTLQEISFLSRYFEYAVRAAIHEQNTYISMVSHELRSPLTAIKGYAGLLHAYGVTDSQWIAKGMTTVRQSRYLTAIMEQVDHLEVLIADLLDVSQLRAGRLSLRCREVNTTQICQRVVVGMQERVERQSPGLYHFQCGIEPNLPLAWADPDRMRQILVNLLENAVKYSPDGGIIELYAYTLQQPKRPRHPLLSASDKQMQPHEAAVTPSIGASSCMIGITICDCGIGIPHTRQEELFQPFVRLQHSSSDHIAGTGLGLYIARCLVEAMHGRIFLRSKQGEGTEVTFTVPTVS